MFLKVIKDCTDGSFGGHVVRRLPVFRENLFMREATEEFVHVSVALCGLVGFLEARVAPVRSPQIASL